MRARAFSSRPMVDEQEVEAVAQSMRQGLFSRFVGSPLPGTRELLQQSSHALVSLDAPFSFLGGPNVRRFEAAWAKFHQSTFAVSFNSATSGLIAALMALDAGPGTEVITTPLSFTATATAIVLAQGVPVFADIDPETMCLDPASVERAITPRTRCILPVHWAGNAGDFHDILAVAHRHGLPVVEDSCQAPGTLYDGRYLGTLGQAGVFSFSEPKNVMTGEGGMLLTGDANLAEKCRLIRNHGEAVIMPEDTDEYLANAVGYNFRMVEASAAMGWVQTSKLAQVNCIRHNNYKRLLGLLTDSFGDVLRPQRITHPDSFAAYTAVFMWDEEVSGLSRDLVAMALRAEGVPVATGVGRLMCDHPMFQRKLGFGRNGHPFREPVYQGRVDYSPEATPVAHRIHDHQYLGFFQTGWPNTPEDMEDISRAFEKILAHRSELVAMGYDRTPNHVARYDRGRG